MEYFADESFLEKSKYLWGKEFIEDFLKWFKELEENGAQECKKRNFIEFKLEFEEACRKLKQDIQELPMIMNCRIKGDSASNFGGKQCAYFVKSIRKMTEKYLKSFSNSKDKGIKDFITKIRDKARINEEYAWEFEKNTKQEYLSLGVDNSLKIFKQSGYNF